MCTSVSPARQPWIWCRCLCFDARYRAPPVPAPPRSICVFVLLGVSLSASRKGAHFHLSVKYVREVCKGGACCLSVLALNSCPPRQHGWQLFQCTSCSCPCVSSAPSRHHYGLVARPLRMTQKPRPRLASTLAPETMLCGCRFLYFASRHRLHFVLPNSALCMLIHIYMCVCVCVCARARVCVCVYVHHLALSHHMRLSQHGLGLVI